MQVEIAKSNLPPERFDGLQTVAHRLDVSVWTIRKWVQEGKIASVRLGKRRLITETH
ncbi:MAG TPA: excisionase family DNA-binding protein [Pyrinomonadaceae bacterium]|nr:excisionase family DNA-binding protein [Pyrinomonadaceae bacterium]